MRETSLEAARMIRVAAPSIRQRVLDILLTGEKTDHELADQYRAQYGEVRGSTVRTRRSELAQLGIVEDSGRRVRLDSGRRAIVWRVTA
jgi:hypothetical protein